MWRTSVAGHRPPPADVLDVAPDLGAEQSVRGAHPPVEPRPPTETADHGNGHRLDHAPSVLLAGVPEVEQGGARRLEPPRLLDRIAVSRQRAEHRNPGRRDGRDLPLAGDLHDPGSAL